MIDPISIAFGLAKFAPTIAGWLGGDDAEDVAKKAVDIAREVTGRDDPEEAVSALERDPNLALEYRKAVLNQKMEFEKLAVADRNSARQREIATEDWTPRVLAGIISVGFFGVLTFMLAHGLPDKGGDALLVMLGALGAGWTAVVSYYFGSSSGSASKNNLLSQLQRGRG